MATLAQPIEDDDIREVQLLIERLAAAGLELRPLGGPTEQEERGIDRALEIALTAADPATVLDVRAARRWWHGRRRSGATNEQLRQAVQIAAAYQLPEAP